jgi:TctA family transporter
VLCCRQSALLVYLMSLAGMLAFTFTLKLGYIWITYLIGMLLGSVYETGYYVYYLISQSAFHNFAHILFVSQTKALQFLLNISNQLILIVDMWQFFFKAEKMFKYYLFLTFRGPCIVMYSYNKTNEMH